jgi:ATP-dependent Zn protease
MKPVYLQDIIVPPERIAEMSKFREFAKRDTPEDLVIKTAWHETGHAIGWALKGGALKRATIIPDGDEHGVLGGLVR